MSPLLWNIFLGLKCGLWEYRGFKPIDEGLKSSQNVTLGPIKRFQENWGFNAFLMAPILKSLKRKILRIILTGPGFWGDKVCFRKFPLERVGYLITSG